MRTPTCPSVMPLYQPPVLMATAETQDVEHFCAGWARGYAEGGL